MSKLEESISRELRRRHIQFEKQVPAPVNDYPWKSIRTRTPPKVDFYLSKYNLYIEVKGFMTMEAISKMAFLSRLNFRYYIFQGTEYEWNPYINNMNPLSTEKSKSIDSRLKQLQINIEEQLNEISSNNWEYFTNISKTSLLRLQDFIHTKIVQYTNWNGEWY